ncbi:MAG TPA: energy transducer TonB [Candidatus Polarisedimenticolia bacterium]|nr:energy transducer TonB [Candidatus Polarisedimenticolia bacterium]
MKTLSRLVAAAMLVPAMTFLILAATPDLKTYFSSDFTDQAYQQKTHKKVGLAWKRPSETPAPGSKTVVIATFLRDGSLLATKLHHKSGSDAWDASGLDAVKKAAPLDPLPKGYKGTSVEIHFHFELNP